jgi:hypothetical protein
MCGSNQQNYTFDLDYIPEDELLQLYQNFSEYVTYYPNMKKIGQITKHIYSSKQVLSDPIEITFSTDFLIDYKFCNEDNENNEKEIIIENLDELMKIYFQIHDIFQKLTKEKYNIHIIFRDEYKLLFDYIYHKDNIAYNDASKHSTEKNIINITVDIDNYANDEEEDEEVESE